MPDTVTIGLISDTHIPMRWDVLPPAIFDIFAGADLIIHAGDIGELWVLDELSRIAPVIAVHGNDEGEQAQAVLPFQHTLMAAGHRIVVTHGHYPDLKLEMERRNDDRWPPKLARLADFARRSDASILISGHTHIPLALDDDGVLVVNPGAVASGGATARQVVQSVALLRLASDVAPVVEHVDINTGQRFTPQLDVQAGFKAALRGYTESILEPELEAQMPWIRDELLPDYREPLLALFVPLLRPRWKGGLPVLTTAEVMTAAKNDGLPQAFLDKLRESEVFAKYL